MKCLRLIVRQESCQVSYNNHLLNLFRLNLCIYTCFVYLQPSCVTLDFKLFIDSIHILFLLYFLPWFGFSTSKPAGFHQNI